MLAFLKTHKLAVIMIMTLTVLAMMIACSNPRQMGPSGSDRPLRSLRTDPSDRTQPRRTDRRPDAVA